MIAPPKAPYVQARHQGGNQKPTFIILRPTFTHSDKGAALAVANAFRTSSTFWDAAHYVIDNENHYRCVRDNVIAGSNNVDKGAIRIAMCANPISLDVFWDENEHALLLNRTAKLVAQLTLLYKIEPQYLDEPQRAKWSKRRLKRRGGIYVVEPNGWPATSFIKEVDAQRDLMSAI